MLIERYIIAPCVLTRENELIPFWDERLSFENSETFSDFITIKGDSRQKPYTVFRECVYDIATKKICAGKPIDSYPRQNEIAFSEGDEVLFEVSHKVLQETKIDSIVYETYDWYIEKGENMSEYMRSIVKEKTSGLIQSSIYAVKIWKPTYVLSNGIRLNSDNKIYHKPITNQ